LDSQIGGVEEAAQNLDEERETENDPALDVTSDEEEEEEEDMGALELQQLVSQY